MNPPASPLPDSDPWARLLVWHDRLAEGPDSAASAADCASESAPLEFSAHVTRLWLRGDFPRAFLSPVASLWEVFGRRTAYSAAVLTVALVALNYSELRDFGTSLDSAVCNPAGLVLGW